MGRHGERGGRKNPKEGWITYTPSTCISWASGSPDWLENQPEEERDNKMSGMPLKSQQTFCSLRGVIHFIFILEIKPSLDGNCQRIHHAVSYKNSARQGQDQKEGERKRLT